MCFFLHLHFKVFCNYLSIYKDSFFPLCTAMKCPMNSYYEICSTSCPATCKDLAPPPNCKDQCEEGCTCKEGFILSGGLCVPFEQCGCIHEDRYYRISEVFYPSGKCQEECKCARGGTVTILKCILNNILILVSVNLYYGN